MLLSSSGSRIFYGAGMGCKLVFPWKNRKHFLKAGRDLLLNPPLFLPTLSIRQEDSAFSTIRRNPYETKTNIAFV